MSRLPLNTLVAFRAVAESQNLRAAAEQLHLTHSAVSQQIRALEERLGFALRQLQAGFDGEAHLAHLRTAVVDDAVGDGLRVGPYHQVRPHLLHRRDARVVGAAVAGRRRVEQRDQCVADLLAGVAHVRT